MIEANKNRVIESIFASMNRRMLRRHFHAVHISGGESVARLDRTIPIIFYGNHSNWWDGLLEFFFSREVFHVDAFLMMDEQQMRRYRFFRWIGAFSVNRTLPRRAEESVRYASELFDRPGKALWIYPQGDMRPNDMRPLRFYSGMSHIARRLGRVQLVPVAHRYEFLMQQKPESFTSFGEAEIVERVGRPKELSSRCEQTLTAQLDALRETVVAGRLGGFVTLLRGRTSTNERYDRIRGLEGL